MNQPSFESLGLSASTLKALRAMGFEHPTPIQHATIPLLLQGEDVLGQAQTGTGKTAAFGIPIAEAFRSERRTGRQAAGPRALVLVPTRELALQVSEELNAIGGPECEAVPVYGGVGFGEQSRALGARGAPCVVATPGRLLDHIERGSAVLDNVAFLVLDEADRMLDMGFLPAVNRILAKLPRDRQTTLFSATMPADVAALANRMLHKPETVRVGEDSLTTVLAEQFTIEASQHVKMAALVALLRAEKPERTLVFVRTRHGARRLGKRLRTLGIDAEALHGDLSQSQREKVMDRFRGGTSALLVATDVAARGLDVPEVSHIVQFDVPTEPETYVHRTGRTGRAGKTGRAFLIATPEERSDVRAIEKLIDRTLVRFDVGPLPDIPAPPHQPQGQRQHGGGRAGRGRGRAHRDHRYGASVPGRRGR